MGAGNKTRYYGGHPYTFGPRHFLTQDSEVFSYLNKIVPIRLCPEHEFISYVEQDSCFYSYPINIRIYQKCLNLKLFSVKYRMPRKTLTKFSTKNFEDYWIGSVGVCLYNKMIRNYTNKMWMVDSPSSIDTFNWSPKGVTIKDGPKAAWENAYSGYPFASDGYDHYFLYSTKNATVLLNTVPEKLCLETRTCSISGNQKCFDIIISTIAPDVLMNLLTASFLILAASYSLSFFLINPCFLRMSTFTYYTNNEDFTRIVEYKKFTRHNSLHL